MIPIPGPARRADHRKRGAGAMRGDRRAERLPAASEPLGASSERVERHLLCRGGRNPMPAEA